MSRIDKLVHSYSQHISIPWRDDIASAQRVIFCVYNERDERSIRAKFAEFELATKTAGHEWNEFDLTDTFPTWLSSQRYAKSYFKRPDLLPSVMAGYLSHIESRFRDFITSSNANTNSVVAITGVGSLFGFLKVKEVVDHLAPKVEGRFLVFFPGSYEGNNYRLLDGYDGWNYLAVPITADKEL